MKMRLQVDHQFGQIVTTSSQPADFAAAVTVLTQAAQGRLDETAYVPTESPDPAYCCSRGVLVGDIDRIDLTWEP